MFAQPSTPEVKLPVTIVTGFLGSGKTTRIGRKFNKLKLLQQLNNCLA